MFLLSLASSYQNILKVFVVDDGGSVTIIIIIIIITIIIIIIIVALVLLSYTIARARALTHTHTHTSAHPSHTPIIYWPPIYLIWEVNGAAIPL